MKETPVHRDALGKTIQIGDFVAFAQSNSLSMGKITKLNPKMVKVLKLPRARSDYNKYPSDIVKVDNAEMTWFMLKHGGVE